jgi:hypothetical protein
MNDEIAEAIEEAFEAAQGHCMIVLGEDLCEDEYDGELTPMQKLKIVSHYLTSTT